MFKQADAIVESLWKNEVLDALCRFVSLRSKSPAFEPDWEKHGLLLQALKEAAAWGGILLPHAVFEIHEEKGITPCLFVDIPATDGGRSEKTAYFYGHLDKQPEAEGWTCGREPFRPSVEDGKLYGRGAADDGYSFYCAMAAVYAMEKAGIGHPRCTAIFETCEETGDADLAFWLGRLAGRCGNVGLITVLDGSAFDYRRLWATTSFRGVVAATVKVQVLSSSMHSGTASGVVPESFMVMRQLLERFEDSATGEIRSPDFYAEIPPERKKQQRQTAEILGNGFTNAFPFVEGARPRYDTMAGLLEAQAWKPQLAVIGADGLPTLPNAGNVLRTHTALRLSIRIPAHVDAGKALESLKKTFTTDVPYGARVEIINAGGTGGWDAKPEQEWFARALDEVSREIYGEPGAYGCDGASIPILSTYEKYFPGAQFFITGVLGPKSNAHGPDEMLNLGYAGKLTRSVCRILARMP